MTIQHRTVRANGIRQHYLDAGEGPPIIVLHGFPETSFAWRYQIPVLSTRYRVIAPDLRGYGETDKPATGYDKRNMARDIFELARSLGIETFAPVGHDRGARVATRLAKDHPQIVDRLVVMDNLPTRLISRNMSTETARAYWFFFFHLVPDLPEALIAGREDIWLRHFFSDGCFNPMRSRARTSTPMLRPLTHPAPGGAPWPTTAPTPKTSPGIWTTPTSRSPVRSCRSGVPISAPSPRHSIWPPSRPGSRIRMTVPRAAVSAPHPRSRRSGRTGCRSSPPSALLR